MIIEKNNPLLNRRTPTAIAITDFPPEVPAIPTIQLSAVAIPEYLERVYWWAYVRPWAIRFFERKWLVNLILFGNYSRLIDVALEEFGHDAAGRTLQVACVYGDLTLRVSEKLAQHGSLDVVDVVPAQLENLRRKLPADTTVSLIQRDSAALGFADATYDRALLYMLLHEQPEAVRRRTLAEAIRVVRPGGKVIIIDYHQPRRWHPLRGFLKFILDTLEPFAPDLWHHEISDYLPPDAPIAGISKDTYFGGMYQKIVLVKSDT
ncbi:MAG: rhodoquinone biosynthesis methyltransferase RquA [Burkholderiales bacterium]